MKIVFIQPKTFHTWEALNIGYLAGYLQKHFACSMEFYSGFYDAEEEIIKAARQADIVAFSSTSPQMKNALYLARLIKNKDNYLVFGGVHPSVLPDKTLENNCIDAVVVGEGEQAFLDIVRGDKNPVVKRNYLSDLDANPFPDRILIKQERNIKAAFQDNGYRIASIFASRGCPYQCSFCASHSVWSRRVRFRSAENVLEEFQQVVKDFRIDFIKFSDDTFTIRKKFVQEFCEQKIKKANTVPWGCNIRVDCVDEELLQLMQQAGCREVWIGVESGSPKILAAMDKKIEIAKIKQVFSLTKKLGFFRRAYILLGMPEESYQDIGLTEQLIDQIQPEAIGFTILAPYPGTAYYSPELHNKVDWSEVDEYGNKLTRTKFLSNDELVAEQRRLVQKYQNKIVFRQKTGV